MIYNIQKEDKNKLKLKAELGNKENDASLLLQTCAKDLVMVEKQVTTV